MPRKEYEHPLLDNEPADLAVVATLGILAAVICVLVAIQSTFDNIQRLDDSFLRTVESHRTGWLTTVGNVFNILGSIRVTLPVRLLAAGYLAFRRRWWHFVAFVWAMALSEILTAALKAAYQRARPPHALVHTSGDSFPSGHAIATAVTTVALVIAFFPTGRQRAIWGTAAAVFSFLMALSRVYLAAHWLSDAVVGNLVGITCALAPAVVVEELRSRRERRELQAQRAPPAEALPPSG